MNNSEILDKAFASIEEFLPGDARKIIQTESKRISQVMDNEIEKFGKEFNAHVAYKVEELSSEIVSELELSEKEISQSINEMKENLAKNDELSKTISELQEKLDNYDKTIKSIASKAKDVIF